MASFIELQALDETGFISPNSGIMLPNKMTNENSRLRDGGVFSIPAIGFNNRYNPNTDKDIDDSIIMKSEGFKQQDNLKRKLIMKCKFDLHLEVPDIFYIQSVLFCLCVSIASIILGGYQFTFSLGTIVLTVLVVTICNLFIKHIGDLDYKTKGILSTLQLGVLSFSSRWKYCLNLLILFISNLWYMSQGFSAIEFFVAYLFGLYCTLSISEFQWNKEIKEVKDNGINKKMSKEEINEYTRSHFLNKPKKLHSK